MENIDEIKQPVKPDNNLVLAIVGAVLGCCSPCCIGLVVGIVSIVFSTQVDSKYRIGDYVGAENAAKNARILAFVAIGLGILGVIVQGIWMAMGGMTEFMEQYQEALEQMQR